MVNEYLQLPEDELINMCVDSMTSHAKVLVGSGDDCAVLSHPDSRSVVSTDILVENVHFRLDWSSPAEIGARAAMQNMADISAMGAAQHSAVVSLTIPNRVSHLDIRDLCDGFVKVYEAAGGAVVGGDVSSGDILTISVTVIGDLEGREPALRSNAKAGDQVIFAGNLGYSPAGYELLTRGIKPTDLPEHLQGIATRAIQLFKAPVCPVEAGVVASKAGVRTMMDVSDGLLRDGSKIAKASGKTLNLCRTSMLPLVAPLEPLANWLQVDPWNWIFNGGEDHGLLATAAPGQLPTGFLVIGEVTEQAEIPAAETEPAAPRYIQVDGQPVTSHGWDHFA